ncbi:MAG: response regulator [Pseudonocardiaceae bacterium]
MTHDTPVPPPLLARRYRVRILGEVQRMDSDGIALEDHFDRSCEQPILVVLALNTRKPCRASLLKVAGFEFPSAPDNDLQRAISRIRGKASLGARRLPIPHRSMQDTYHLDLPWWEVDATSFVMATRNVETLSAVEIEHLLGLWQADPRELYPSVPQSEWRQLVAATGELDRHIQTLPRAEREGLTNLNTFRAEVMHTTNVGLGQEATKKSLLVIEDNSTVAGLIADMLSDYRVHIVSSMRDSLEFLREHHGQIDGAVIDLHLDNEKLDYSGLTVLERMSSDHAEVPRLLITSSTIQGSVEKFKAEYGLSEIVFKAPDEKAIPHLLIAVERMINDRRLRRIAQFNADTAAIGRAIGGRLTAHRRKYRLHHNEAAMAAAERTLADLEAFHESCETFEAELGSIDDAELDQRIRAFLARFENYEKGRPSGS